MLPNIILELVDGVRVVVPDSLNLLTTYVLAEQKDWFEDEIKFLRRLIQPGQKVIDIGANSGVYALTMAKLVGPTGHVWAFEPASAPANLLASGIAANNLTNLDLIRSALSNAPGTAQLSVSDHSESNELVRDVQPTGATETVSCETLDDAMVRYGWSDISFVKIDAEGEESNILRGGTLFLATESPLIQYEVRASGILNLELVDHFSHLGYLSYRLVPGLGLLLPFDVWEGSDDYLLNLFCCKRDEAGRLAARGVLVETGADISAVRLPEFCGGSDPSERHGWRRALVELPYGALLAQEWMQLVPDDESATVEQSLFYYALSQDTALPPAERLAALTTSYRQLQGICATQPTNLRLSSLARVALDYGDRALVVDALDRLCQLILQHGRQINTSEPFLAPSARFDAISPGGHQELPRWLAAAALEQLEKNQYFSSYFSGEETKQRLEMIRDMRFGSEEMQRRLWLIQHRFPGPQATTPITHHG